MKRMLIALSLPFVDRVRHNPAHVVNIILCLLLCSCASEPRLLGLSMRSEMERYRKEHPACEACGERPVEVHHVLPQAQRPDLASCYTNYISLCFRHHRSVGHPINTHTWNVNVRETARTIREGMRR